MAENSEIGYTQPPEKQFIIEESKKSNLDYLVTLGLLNRARETTLREAYLESKESIAANGEADNFYHYSALDESRKFLAKHRKYFNIRMRPKPRPR